ncbi:MAG: GNAT family N-acetyltransferase [Chloroflexi bacterium]|nr:GNAT family N-acetyltransferase [Chloroflexota bacterium]
MYLEFQVGSTLQIANELVRCVEEISLNALPALQTMHLDGWVLRFANGYTKRANSINPIYDGADNVEEKIRFCEEIYRRKHLPVVFKMTKTAQPENLDSILADKGYEINSPTSVQIAELGNVDSSLLSTCHFERSEKSRLIRDEISRRQNPPPRNDRLCSYDSSPNAQATETLTEEWFAQFCRMNNIAEKNKSTLWQILANIDLPKCFVTVGNDGKSVACGMSVMQGQYIGLFDIVTDASFRNKGFGKQTVRRLLAWGKENGARRAYLQVMENNAPALQLYSQVGFTPVYQYWYRIKN